MEKKKTYVTVTILFLTYIALVFFCCLYSFSNTELDISKYFLGIRLDRYVHFTMFFPYPFSAWLFIHYNGFTKRLCNHQFIIIILSGLIFAAIAEGMQSMITQNRETDYFDYLANSIGILSATTIIAVFQRQIRIISNFFFAKKWGK